ncbi:MAG: PAS domain-containing protein [Bacteroidia bacterium]|nr:PAS domain-containing protein [Bacteroidia bacterium]
MEAFTPTYGRVAQALADHARQDSSAAWALLDEAGRFIALSRRLTDWLGQTEAELVGTDFLQLLPPPQVPLARQVHRLVRSGVPEIARVWSLLRPNSTPAKILVNWFRQESDEGPDFEVVHFELPEALAPRQAA